MKTGFTCGAFDVTHTGHILMFKECKEICDYLIVGLQTDPSIDRDDKMKPVQSIWERYLMLKGIQYIDEIVPYETEEDLYELLKVIMPDIRIIGADWEGKKFTGHDLDIKNYFNKRQHNLSSTNLKKRVYESLKGEIEDVR